MGRLKYRWLFLVCLLAIGSMFWLYSGRQADSPLVVDQPQTGVSFADVKLIGRKLGQPQWEVVSQSMRDESERVLLDGLEQVTIIEDLQARYMIGADRGTWYRQSDNLELNDGVLLTQQDGFSIATERLIWYAEQERIEFLGETRVTFNQGGNDNE